MAHATGSRRRIIYGTEGTFNEKASVVTYKELRNTGDSLNLTKNAITSSELSGDRAIRFMRHGNETVSGDISFEFAYGAFDDLLAAALGNSWVLGVDEVGTDTLKQGTTVPTFSIEKGFQDITQYQVFTGCAVNTLSLDMSADAVVTGSFGFVGAGATEFSGVTVSASPTEATLTEPFTSHQSQGAIKIGGTDTCIVTALNLSVDNGITANYSLCGPEAVSLTPDRVNVTGTITALFENATELNKFINETETSLEFTVTDPDGNLYTFSAPKIKYSGGDAPVSGGGVVSISLPFQALYEDDGDVNSALVITRTTA